MKNEYIGKNERTTWVVLHFGMVVKSRLSEVPEKIKGNEFVCIEFAY